MSELQLPPAPAGHTLPQAFYAEEAVYRRDVRMLAQTQWLLVDHASRIPSSGDYFLFEYGDESIIFVRDRSGQVRSFYNVCRHRGSRVLLAPEGRVAAMSCPYHSWTYDLSGALRSAQHMPDGFCKEDNGLVPLHVRVHEGLIFLNMNPTLPPDFDAFLQAAAPVLAQQRLGDAKVAARRNIPNAANWKLVVENFLECYHCKPAHPLLCSIHDERKLLAFGAGAGSGDDFARDFEPLFNAWSQEQQSKGNYTEQHADTGPHFQAFGRLPIGRGNITESVDGRPLAPPMLKSGELDGAQIYMTFNPVSTVLANCDYAVMFRFTPRGPQLTDAEAVFLVRGDAVAGRDYDEEELVRFWAVTLDEDKRITQNNQAGVNSAVYRPGLYSKQEQRIADFTSWYLHTLEPYLRN
ncbi:MAG: aromatic ring-hydroxylating dioxygenase subunit alpha [Betaproteobacteria bacterium]|nr:aromatic ring-hydroxylating dioxygenase subunit alpha [Betaproteobacteria bacterium]